MRYQYYISTTGISGTYSEIFPNVQAKLSTKLENDTNDFRWCYRDKCSEIKLTKSMNSAIYATLASWFTDTTKHATQIFIKVYRGTSAGTLIYTGYFSITDGELNTQNGVYAVTPITQDNYTIFDQVRDKDIEAWGLIMGTDDVRIPYLTTLGTWTNDPGEPFDAFTGITNAVTNAEDTNAAPGNIEKCYLPVTGAFVTDQTVKVKFTSYNKISGTNPDMYLTNSTGTTPITSAATLSAAGEYTFTILSDATNARLVIRSYVNVLRFNCEVEYVKPYYSVKDTGAIIWDGFKLISLLDFYLDNAGYATATIKSTFFFNDALPTNPPSAINTYIGANPTHNYVTEAVNKLNDLYFIDRDDFKDIVGSTRGLFNTQFSEFMGSLNYYFNVYWYIDDDGKFRLEHYKYFEGLGTAGIDITAGVYPAYKPEVDNKKYRFAKQKQPQIEHWENQYDKNTDFLGRDIIYSVYPTSEAIKDYQVTLISSDIEYLYDTLTDGIEGLLMVQTVDNGAFQDVEYETGVLSTDVIVNGHLALANLHAAYWMNGRFYEAGTMNGAAETFDTVIPTQESSVKFPTTADLNDYGYVTTSFGDGIIDEYDRNLDTDFITAKLLYEAY